MKSLAWSVFAIAAIAVLTPYPIAHVCGGIALFGAAVFLSGITFRTSLSALSGGVAFTFVWLAGFRVSYTMGLWHAGAASLPQTAVAVPFWAYFTGSACYFAVYAVGAWLVLSRFRWQGLVALAVAVGITGAIRDGVIGRWANTMLPTNGSTLLLGLENAVAYTAGLLLALTVMRLVSGGGRYKPYPAEP